MQGIKICLKAIDTAIKYGLRRQVILDNLSPSFEPMPYKICKTRQLNEFKSKTLLSQAGLCVPPSQFITIEDALTGRFDHLDLTFPVVAKICSADIAHKTEFGGVYLNIASNKDLEVVIPDLVSSVKSYSPGVQLDGVLIEKMVAKPLAELMLSLRRDPHFGLVMTLASGGIMTELIEDTVSLLMPSNSVQILRAIENLRVTRLLEGFRGGEVVSPKILLKSIENLTSLMQSKSNIVEIEINPVIINVDQATCADALVTISD